MNIEISSEIKIDNPTEELKKYAVQNFWVENPEYKTKKRLKKSVWNVPEKLDLYYIKENQLIVPYGFGKELKPFFSGNDNITLDLGEPKKIDYKADISLWDYQEAAVNEMVKAKNGILQSAAGSGKTQMGIALICRLGLKALWLTHTTELISQSYERAKKYVDESMLGKITAGKINIGKGITFATVQTLCRQDLSRYKYEFDVIVVDECHRVSGTPTKRQQFEKVLNSIAARHKYGVSATVHRSDGMIKACFALLGSIAYTVPQYAVKNKIMQVKIQKRELETEKSSVYLDGSGMLEYSKLIEYLVSSDMRNLEIVKDLKANSNHRCLILSDRIAHLEYLKDMLDSESAVLVHGKSKKADREKAIADMKNKSKKYLFASYSLAKEGLDIPCLDRLFLVTPHSDFAVVTQSIGRIARVSEDKDDAVCYDYVDVNIGFCTRNFKKRCTHYRKAGCL